MVIADPASELLHLVTAGGDPPAATASDGDRRAAELIRRRFGLSLPPPFVDPPGASEPIRVATVADGAAIAAIKWRAFGISYRGVLPDHFLDQREIVPPVSFWIGRAMVPPSRFHRLVVWGRPGTVFGYADVGPVHPPGLPNASPGVDPEPDDSTGEVYELYVDPTAQRRGGGRLLLAAAEEWFRAVGYARAELSAVATNERAHAFYRGHGWEPTGQVIPVDLGTVAFEEVRFARHLRASSP